jgi:hypothetical protein
MIKLIDLRASNWCTTWTPEIGSHKRNESKTKTKRDYISPSSAPISMFSSFFSLICQKWAQTTKVSYNQYHRRASFCWISNLNSFTSAFYILCGVQQEAGCFDIIVTIASLRTCGWIDWGYSSVGAGKSQGANHQMWQRRWQNVWTSHIQLVFTPEAPHVPFYVSLHMLR